MAFASSRPKRRSTDGELQLGLPLRKGKVPLIQEKRPNPPNSPKLTAQGLSLEGARKEHRVHCQLLADHLPPGGLSRKQSRRLPPRLCPPWAPRTAYRPARRQGRLCRDGAEGSSCPAGQGTSSPAQAAAEDGDAQGREPPPSPRSRASGPAGGAERLRDPLPCSPSGPGAPRGPARLARCPAALTWGAWGPPAERPQPHQGPAPRSAACPWPRLRPQTRPGRNPHRRRRLMGGTRAARARRGRGRQREAGTVQGGGRGRFRRRMPEPGSGATAPGFSLSAPETLPEASRAASSRTVRCLLRFSTQFSHTISPAVSLLSHYTLVSAVIRGLCFVSSAVPSPRTYPTASWTSSFNYGSSYVQFWLR